MRGLFVASVLAAGLAGSLAASVPPQPVTRGRVALQRKTMGFGPDHPHSVYRNDVPQAFQPATFSREPQHPFDIAQEFVQSIVPQSSFQDGEMSFYVRPDSYIDPHTGLAFVYLRQVIYGIEVVDGDVNVNINKHGQIVSYGSSAHTLTESSMFTATPNVDVHDAHCRALLEELNARRESVQERLAALQYERGVAASGQTTMGHVVSDDLDVEIVKSGWQAMGQVPRLVDWNCKRLATISTDSVDTASEYSEDPLAALLAFITHATPDEGLAQSISAAPTEYLEDMSLTFTPHLTNENAPASAVFEVEGAPDTTDKVKGRMAWVQVPKEGGNGEMGLELVWKFEVPMHDNWYEAAVTHSAPHRIVSVVDWVSDGFVDEPAHAHLSDFVAPIPQEPPVPRAPALYNVFAWGVNDPSEANRTFELENFDSLASPYGWHVIEDGSEPNFKKPAFHNTTTTWGNNVFAHENWEGENAWVANYRPEATVNSKVTGGPRAEFDFPYDPHPTTERPDSMREAKKYINATVTQLFYTSNLVHDFFYRYGFNEVSGNFQQYNLGRGGKENDAVIANAQDGSGFNNANFLTPPDGTNGRCRMYLWNTANPYRDGDLEAGIVIHELAHGLSTRLTGGPANSGCLGWGESGGMGEGWGDFLATTIRSAKDRAEDAKLADDGLGEPRDYPMGAWASNRVAGIRNFPYSLNATVNPSTYKTLDKPGYWGVHAIGEVWAEILWVVEQHLIQKHNFSATLFPPKPLENGTVPLGDFYREDTEELVPKHGNTLLTQLVVTGMKLQPCRPTFFKARDAIIQADKELTGGENTCDLWRGFAERGLGPDAKVVNTTPWGGGVRTDDFKVPDECAL